MPVVESHTLISYRNAAVSCTRPWFLKEQKVSMTLFIMALGMILLIDIRKIPYCLALLLLLLLLLNLFSRLVEINVKGGHLVIIFRTLTITNYSLCTTTKSSLVTVLEFARFRKRINFCNVDWLFIMRYVCRYFDLVHIISTFRKRL